MNTTKLLKLIVQMADKNNIEIRNVKLYPEAVEVNEKVKVKIYSSNGFLVENSFGHTNGFDSINVTKMLEQVLTELQSIVEAGDIVSYEGKEYKIIKIEHCDEYYLLDMHDSTFNIEEVFSHEELQYDVKDGTYTKVDK